MIHLVHFSSSPGGIEVLIQDVIRAFPAGTFRVFVIRPPGPKDYNVYTNTDVQINYGKDVNIFAICKLWQYAWKYRKDTFHVFNIGPFFLLVLRLAGIKKLIYSVRGTTYWNSYLQKIIRRKLWRTALSGRYRIIANSEYSRSVFLKSIKKIKPEVEVLYNPIASSKYAVKKSRVKTKAKYKVIYAGRLTSGKNLFKWLDVALFLHKSVPGIYFELYGDGPLKEELINYSHRIGISEDVKFMGFTTDIADMYHEADLLIFISEYESFGNVVVESVLSGTPVIASDIFSMREIFINFPQVLVPLDENLEINILEKVQHPEILNSLIPDMISEFSVRFSAINHIEKISRMYNSLVDK
jgi:glycosyltransferase involved in cell wall biosynthesis